MTQSQVIQVACYSREVACWFWRFVREWKVQSRGLHRDFRGSACNSLVGRPSSHEKHLENFFHNFIFECFGSLPLRLVGDSPQLRKTRVWQKVGQFLNLLSFPSNFLWLFTVFPFLSQLNLPKHFVSHSLNSIFASFLLQSSRKKYGFSLSHLISSCFKSNFRFLGLSLWIEIYCVWTCSCLDCWVSVSLVSSLCIF